MSWSPRKQLGPCCEQVPGTFDLRNWVSQARVPEAPLVFMSLWVSSDWLPTHLYAAALKEHGLLWNQIQQE